jgi:hypothetical protein
VWRVNEVILKLQQTHPRDFKAIIDTSNVSSVVTKQRSLLTCILIGLNRIGLDLTHPLDFDWIELDSIELIGFVIIQYI